MLNSFPISVIVGTLLGFLSGIGVGGGSLLILWLTLIIGTDPQTARMINLLFFLPAAAISCWFRRKQGFLNRKHSLPAAAAGCIGAFTGTILLSVLSTELLRKGFGILLLATGIRELLYKPKKQAPQ